MKKLTAKEIDFLFGACEFFDAKELRLRLVEHFCDCAVVDKKIPCRDGLAAFSTGRHGDNR